MTMTNYLGVGPVLFSLIVIYAEFYCVRHTGQIRDSLLDAMKVNRSATTNEWHVSLNEYETNLSNFD